MPAERTKAAQYTAWTINGVKSRTERYCTKIVKKKSQMRFGEYWEEHTHAEKQKFLDAMQ